MNNSIFQRPKWSFPPLNPLPFNSNLSNRTSNPTGNKWRRILFLSRIAIKFKTCNINKVFIGLNLPNFQFLKPLYSFLVGNPFPLLRNLQYQLFPTPRSSIFLDDPCFTSPPPLLMARPLREEVLYGFPNPALSTEIFHKNRFFPPLIRI